MKLSFVPKTVVVGLLPFSLLLSPIASAAESTTSASNEELVLTMDKAIEKTLGNSRDLERKRIEMETSDLENIMAKKDAKEISIDSLESLDDAQSKYQDSAKAYKNMRVAYLSYKDAERKLKMDTTLAYFDALHANSLAERSELAQAFEKLNQLMGETASREWKITNQEKPVAYTLPTLEEAIQFAIQNRPDIMKKQEELTFANLKVALISRWNTVGSLEGRVATNNLKLAKMNYDDNYKVVVADVTKNYETLKDATERKEQEEQRFKDERPSGVSYQNAVHEYNQALTAYLYALGY